MLLCPVRTPKHTVYIVSLCKKTTDTEYKQKYNIASINQAKRSV